MPCKLIVNEPFVAAAAAALRVCVSGAAARLLCAC